jgi:hypothetical protein
VEGSREGGGEGGGEGASAGEKVLPGEQGEREGGKGSGEA